MAAAAGCSSSALRRQFQHYLHVTPLEWVASLKLRHATELLRTTSLPVSEVGEKIGIVDPFYFSRWFKRLTGQSPRQARTQSRKL
jgi:AraC-like DNA-binding protein